MADEEKYMQPIALGAEITGTQPSGYHYNGESIVLFRDERGIIRALENRCCHRRVPLTLGTVRTEGWLQCGYHGWSFDGVSGQCKAIPNLPDERKVPPAYGVYAYAAKEKHGVVYVASKNAPEKTIDHLLNTLTCSASGRVMVGLSPADYIAGLLDAPSLMLKIRGLRIADTMICDPIKEGDFWRMERAAYWVGQVNFDAFIREYKLLLRVDVHLPSGQCWLSIRSVDDQIVSALQLSISPVKRGVSAVLWRALKGEAEGLKPALLRSFLAAPMSPRKTIDNAALASLLEGPSDGLPRYCATALFGGELLETRGNTQWQSVQ